MSSFAGCCCKTISSTRGGRQDPAVIGCFVCSWIGLGIIDLLGVIMLGAPPPAAVIYLICAMGGTSGRGQ
jgi:hypothetical protein